MGYIGIHFHCSVFHLCFMQCDTFLLIDVLISWVSLTWKVYFNLAIHKLDLGMTHFGFQGSPPLTLG